MWFERRPESSRPCRRRDKRSPAMGIGARTLTGTAVLCVRWISQILVPSPLGRRDRLAADHDENQPRALSIDGDGGPRGPEAGIDWLDAAEFDRAPSFPRRIRFRATQAHRSEREASGKGQAADTRGPRTGMVLVRPDTGRDQPPAPIPPAGCGSASHRSSALLHGHASNRASGIGRPGPSGADDENPVGCSVRFGTWWC